MIELLKNNRKIILAVSVCLFAVCLVYRLTHIYKQPRVTALTYTGVKASSPEKKAVRKNIVISPEEPMVKLELFLNPMAHSREAKKNIFSAQTIVEKYDKPSVAPASEERPGNEAPAVNAENQIKDDLGTFRSFGYAERGGERVLFIEKGKQIMLVRKGDRIEGKYIVKDITQKELTLIVVATNETVHIDLSQL
jgi:hypothetical protein